MKVQDLIKSVKVTTSKKSLKVMKWYHPLGINSLSSDSYKKPPTNTNSLCLLSAFCPILITRPGSLQKKDDMPAAQIIKFSPTILLVSRREGHFPVCFNISYRGLVIFICNSGRLSENFDKKALVLSNVVDMQVPMSFPTTIWSRRCSAKTTILQVHQNGKKRLKLQSNLLRTWEPLPRYCYIGTIYKLIRL